MQAYNAATPSRSGVWIQHWLQSNIDAWEGIYHGWLVKVEKWRIADSTKIDETVEIMIEPQELKSHLRTAIGVSIQGTIDLIFPMSFSPDLHAIAILKSVFFLPTTAIGLGSVRRKTLTFGDRLQGNNFYRILFSFDKKYAAFEVLPDSYPARCDGEVGVFDLTSDNPQLIWEREVRSYGRSVKSTIALHPSITYIAWSCAAQGTILANFLDPRGEGLLPSLLNTQFTG